MDKIKIVVGGSKGRMSQCIAECAEQDLELSLIAQTDQTKGGLSAIHDPFDVFIDFTHPAALEAHLALCCQRGQRMVLGVTGFSAVQKAQIEQASRLIPIVCSPNMSVGINVSFKVVDLIAQALKDKGEAAVQETHHKHKQDKPSGTALKLGEVIARAWGKPINQAGINFTSSRIGEVLGEHTVLFTLPGEQLEIKHKTEDRSVFAQGALLAAKWLMDRSPGLYDMQDVLGLK